MNQAIDKGVVEQARLAQSFAAGATARSNKPRYLLVIAIGVLAIAAAYTVSASSSLTSARRGVKAQRDQAGGVAALAAQYLELKNKRQEDVFPPRADTAARIEEVANSLDLLKPNRVRQGDATNEAPGIVNRHFTTVIRSTDPQPILEFLNRTIGAEVVVEGLELSDVKLKPVSNLATSVPGTTPGRGWEATITFSRFERSG